jgi:hypothetical protein
LKSIYCQRLYFVDALLVGGDSKIYCRVIHRFPSFPFKDSSPWTVLDDGTWSSDVREVLSSAPREVVVFGEFWPEHPLPLLVPTSACWD